MIGCNWLGNYTEIVSDICIRLLVEVGLILLQKYLGSVYPLSSIGKEYKGREV